MKWLALAISVCTLSAQTDPPESPALHTGPHSSFPYKYQRRFEVGGLSCGDELGPIYAELLHPDGIKTNLIGGDFHEESATRYMP